MNRFWKLFAKSNISRGRAKQALLVKDVTDVSTDDSSLREVDQELAEEQQFQALRRSLPLLGGGAAAIVLGVAGWQFYTAQKTAKAEAAALIYQDALSSLEESPQNGVEIFGDAVQGESEGYAALATFQQAALLSAQGDTARAYQLYRSVLDMENVTKSLKDLARLRAGYLSLDRADRDTVVRDLDSLPGDPTPLGFYARELIALAELSERNYDAAIATFDTLAGSIETPPSLRARASEFAIVARAGKTGSNISGEARVEDLLNRLGDSPAGSSVFPVTDAPAIQGAGTQEGGQAASEAEIEVPPSPTDIIEEAISELEDAHDHEGDHEGEETP